MNLGRRVTSGRRACGAHGDFCVVFDVPFDSRGVRVHETACTRDGALVGALFDTDGGELAGWSEELIRTAERVATMLDGKGYFGPVCIDAFSWRDGERLRYR